MLSGERLPCILSSGVAVIVARVALLEKMNMLYIQWFYPAPLLARSFSPRRARPGPSVVFEFSARLVEWLKLVTFSFVYLLD